MCLLHLVPIVLSWMPESSTFCMIHDISRIMKFLKYSSVGRCWHSVCLWVLHWLTHLQYSCQLMQPPTLAQMLHTCAAPHARLVPTCDAARVGTDVATHARPMTTLDAPRVGTLVATQGSCQLSDKCWTGGGGWLVLTIVVPPWTQNRWKLGILPRVLTTVSHWLALWLLLVVQ